MRIVKLNLKGFKNKERTIDIDFSKEQITILYGENGCGKTSLLKIISAIFSKDEDVLLTENIDEVYIELEENNRIDAWTIKRNENLIEEKQEEIVRDKYTWGDFPCDKSTILFGVNRGISYNVEIQPTQIEQFLRSPMGEKYGRLLGASKYRFAEELTMSIQRMDTRIIRNRVAYRKLDFLDKKNVVLDKLDMQSIEMLLFDRYKMANSLKTERVQNALFRTLSEAVYVDTEKHEKQIPISFRESLETDREKLLEALYSTQDNEFQQRIISILENDSPDKIVEECEKNKLLLNLLVNMMEELNEDEGILESINTLTKIFNEHISKEKRLQIDNNGVYIAFKDSINNHGLAKLSSGEKHLLSFLTIAMIVGKDKNLILIDEPELSLNIRWKRVILDEIAKMVPEAQIITATHSSTIANGKINSLVKMK